MAARVAALETPPLCAGLQHSRWRFLVAVEWMDAPAHQPRTAWRGQSPPAMPGLSVPPVGLTGPIRGVHRIGPWVTEPLGQGYLAVDTEAGPDQIGRLIQPHPTLSESFGENVLALTWRRLHLG